MHWCSAGWQVTLSARRLKQAEKLRRRSLHWWKGWHWVPAGVKPPVEERHSSCSSMPRRLAWRRSQAKRPGRRRAVPGARRSSDLVYNPAETSLVQAARHAGLGRANGLGMLVEQARWHGNCRPVARSSGNG